MNQILLSVTFAALCLVSIVGCGPQQGTTVSPPPEVVSDNVDAERAKAEGGGTAAGNVDYQKQ